MNTFAKYCPNVWVAKTEKEYQKGDIINLTTKYGKEVECKVHNKVFEKDGVFYYSIQRTDEFNYAEKRAAKLLSYASNAEKKANQYYEASNKDKDFLVLGEPIKIGHHSEKRHRKIIEQAHNNFGKYVELSDKAEKYEDRAAYWEEKAKNITLANPESLEYFEFKLNEAKAKHEGLKSGLIPKSHSFSLTYAKKDVNELEKKLITARKLWA